MTPEQMASLRPGDVVRHIMEAEALVISANLGDRAIAVRTATLTNPAEWVMIRPASDQRYTDGGPRERAPVSRPAGT